ncbi:MAG: hypothetical protein QOH84_6015 [Kribbellaceae bacterium]|jgi:hypothetical protein|nr:hypothetical protein [Kribbellaceae bacterium]
MFRGLFRSTIVLAVGAVAIVLPTSAAQAASGVTLTPPATVHGNTAEDCYPASFHYAISVDPAVASWTLDVTVISPDGSIAGGDLFTDIDLATGSNVQSLCPYSDPYGTYTISGTLTTRDSSFNTLEVTSTAANFQYVRPVHSVTQFQVSRHRLYLGHQVKMKIRTMRAGKAWANAKVRIEMRVYGVWTKLTSGHTGKTGRASLTLTPKKTLLSDNEIGGHTFRFRAVVDDATFTFGDTSPVQKIRFG